MANAGADTRSNIEIPSGTDRMAGWLYPSPKYTSSSNPGPALVLAHGLGGVKEMRLDVFAAEFQARGYTCVVFDYRCHGGSTGVPRGLIDFGRQQQDWRAAVAYARKLERVDPERVGVFGTSFSGGHVIQLAAGDPRIKAVVSQCPFTDGWKSALCCGVTVIPRLVLLGLRDALFGTEKKPVTVPLCGKPGEAALMNAADVIPGYPSLMPEGLDAPTTAPARLVVGMPLLRPGSYAAKVQCPIIFGLCARDSVAPAKASLAYAKKAPKGVIKWYDDMGHFDIYVGENHERAFRDYIEFLETHLPA